MADAPLLSTPLLDWHRDHGARLVEFGGWSMPVQYSTIGEEHQAVRERVGLFDISHMGRLVGDGPDAERWIEYLTTNHVAKLVPGQIQYSLICDERGGILDDVLVYRMGDGGLRIVCNAANRGKLGDHIAHHAAGFDAAIIDHTMTTAMIAVQGPRAAATLAKLCGDSLNSLRYYHVTEGRFPQGRAAGTHAVISRTGYTGEDGFELIVPAGAALAVWDDLMEAGEEFGIRPCGLGARDTLRLEAAMPLYGHEMDETVNPFAAGLGWAVKLDKGEFLGREALKAWKANPGRKRIGLAIDSKRVARQGAPVFSGDQPIGAVTSGTYSPTLTQGIALALVDRAAELSGASLSVDIRGHREPARLVSLPFYRRERPSA